MMKKKYILTILVIMLLLLFVPISSFAATASITSPKLNESYLTEGMTLNVTCNGTDPDGAGDIDTVWLKAVTADGTIFINNETMTQGESISDGYVFYKDDVVLPDDINSGNWSSLDFTCYINDSIGGEAASTVLEEDYDCIKPRIGLILDDNGESLEFILCSGTYTMNTALNNYAVILDSVEVNVSCNETIMQSDSETDNYACMGITENNVSVFGCTFKDYQNFIHTTAGSTNYTKVFNNTFLNRQESGLGLRLEGAYFAETYNNTFNDSDMGCFYTRNSSFYDNYLTNNSRITSNYCNDNTFFRNILINNSYEFGNAVSFSGSSSSGNILYDNNFTNTTIESDINNYWNTTKDCSGTNIIGGDCIGGNYYDDYSGEDWECDGIGDDPSNYTINATNVYDYLPLTNNCDVTPPWLAFIDPTPDNDTLTSDTTSDINISINESRLKELIYIFNDVNHTYYSNDTILWYNFDNVSALGENSTHVVDLSRNGYNLSLNGGATITTDGVYRNGIEFDGTGYGAIHDLYFSQSGELQAFTACAWFNTTFYDSYNFANWAFLDFDRSEYFNFYITGKGIIGFSTSSSSGAISDTYGTTTVNDGEEHFACVSFNSSWTKPKKIFVDGVLDQEVTGHGTGVDIGSGDFTRYGFVGDGSEATSFNGSRNGFYYEGKMDTVFFLNRSILLSEHKQFYYADLNKYDTDKWLLEINQLLIEGENTYQACASDTGDNENCTEVRYRTLDTAPPVITVISPEEMTYGADGIDFNVSLSKAGAWCGYSLDGPELYEGLANFWKFENTADDMWGTNDATAYGVTVTNGYSGFGYYFDGNDYIVPQNSNYINLGRHGKRLLIIRFNVTDKDLVQKQVIWEEGAAVRGLNIYIDSGYLYVGGWNTPVSESGWTGTWLNTSSITSNTWHTVALWLSGVDIVEDDVIRAYLDGVNFANGSGSQLWGHSGDINIGRNGDTVFHDGADSSDGEYFTGVIDEVLNFVDEDFTDEMIVNISNNGTLNSLTEKNSTYFYHAGSDLTEGRHDVRFYCNDSISNFVASEHITFGVDLSPPIITLEHPVEDGFLNYSINIDFNYTPEPDGGNIDTCKLYGNWNGGWHINQTDDTIIDDATNTFVVDIGVDGTYVYNAWCNESFGNSDFSQQGNLTFTIDTSGPEIEITYPENITYTVPVTEMNYSFIESNPSECWYSTDSWATNISVECGETVSDLVGLEGANTWGICINDTGGHEACDNVTFTRYTPPFDIEVLSPLNRSYNTSDIWFNLSMIFADDDINVSSCKFTLNDWAQNTTMTIHNETFSYYENSSMDGGSYTVNFWCNDTNNVINDDEEVTFKIDSTPPIISMQSPQNISYTNRTIEINTTTNEEIDTWFYSINGTTNKTFTPNSTFTSPQGFNNITVCANDTAGNWNCTGIIYFTVDSITPVVTIHSPENKSYNTTGLTLNVSASETIDAWLYNLNDAGNLTFSPNISITGSEGLNSLFVYANDSLGNTGTDSVYFTVDTISPIVTIHSPENITYNESTVNLTVSANENIDTWLYSLDGGVNTTFTPNTTISGTSDSHNLTVYANDTAGNWNYTRVYFTINVTAPYIVIHTPENTTYDTNIATINVSCNETIDTWLYSLNGAGNITLINETNTLIAIQNDSNVLIVYGNDTIGDWGSSTVYFTGPTTPEPTGGGGGGGSRIPIILPNSILFTYETKGCYIEEINLTAIRNCSIIIDTSDDVMIYDNKEWRNSTVLRFVQGRNDIKLRVCNDGTNSIEFMKIREYSVSNTMNIFVTIEKVNKSEILNPEYESDVQNGSGNNTNDATEFPQEPNILSGSDINLLFLVAIIVIIIIIIFIYYLYKL